MSDQLQILIIEDESILALDLRQQLQREGYQVVGIAPTGARAMELFRKEQVDLVLCDINIKGELDGIETSHRLMAERAVPLIYMTAYSDRAMLNRAKETIPAAYLVKPVNIVQLRLAIDLAISNFARPIPVPPKANAIAPPEADRDLSRDSILQIDKQVFIKNNGQFLRINLTEVQYLEADNIYTTLVTAAKKYALRLSLGQVLERIDYSQFVRLHRSYAINIDQVDSFNEHEVTIGSRQIPIGRSYREHFISRFTFR